MRIQDIIPSSVRTFLLKIHQNYLWPIELEKFKKTIEKGEDPSKELIKKLVYAWGNQGFSAQIDYLGTCIESLNDSKGLIFECGSGLSTILLGIIAKKQNRKMISFEHIDFWASKIQKELDRNNLENIIYKRKLKNYGDYEWYNIENIEIDTIGCCICDAPPAKTKGGRRGFFYIFKDKLVKNSIILVDDMIREDEQKMVKEWSNEMAIDVKLKGSFDPHAVLRIL